MTYNIHPILVHFPIALLFVYSILKIVPFKKWFPMVAWRDIQVALLTFGFLGGIASLITGETAEHLVKPNHQLVETHSTFATTSMIIYGALLAGEIASLILIMYGPRITSALFTKILKTVECIFTHRVFSTVLAIVGFFSIAMTGLLGGIIVFGTSADPLAAPVLQLLGITL